MPMVLIVLVVIGMILLVGWLTLGFGRPSGDRVTDPMMSDRATPQGTPTEPLPQPDPLPDRQPQQDPNTIPPTP